ncbi:hypothetical protein FIBSPDRAFT_963693 [Athelia psychrophila]|uniref:Uncharacterized protein n=1 Tax=Athelia psychrophila TaxID=1759441 RepID=A0A165YN88_9AGAM|nr:hypothetical protein FIBSPDRAFT_963693 [Fibularhizoctonia sp. CBS 109695]
MSSPTRREHRAGGDEGPLADGQEAAVDDEVLGRGIPWMGATPSPTRCLRAPARADRAEHPTVLSYALRLDTYPCGSSSLPALLLPRINHAACGERRAYLGLPCAIYYMRTVGICIEQDEIFSLERVSSRKPVAVATDTFLTRHHHQGLQGLQLVHQPVQPSQPQEQCSIQQGAVKAAEYVGAHHFHDVRFAAIFIPSHLDAFESVTYLLVRTLKVSHMTRGLASCGYSPPPGVLRDYRQVRDRLSTRKALHSALTTCYINSILSQLHIKRACENLGIHCAMTSIVFPRSRGAASPIYYWTKRELLETGRGDDIVIIIENGAVIAVRVVLFPGTRVCTRLYMGSGAQGRRDADYQDGSDWMGHDHGEAACFNRGEPSTKHTDTITARILQLGDDVDMNDISVVVHINSRGNFALTQCRKPRVPYTP